MAKDKKKQKKRADAIRAQIKTILDDEAGVSSRQHRRNAPRVEQISPREFIHKRMAALRKNKEKL
jgi:hypothetical protein